MSHLFNTSSIQRLNQFLSRHKLSGNIERLTPDASTREFFRIVSGTSSVIACLYPEIFDDTLPQIDVTNLFLACGLPVAEIFEIDYDLGLVLHEDFGNRILRDVLDETDKRGELINDAIALIAKIQHSTPKAFELDSIASRLKFDQEKLLWELDFFRNHYFGSFKKTKLDRERDEALTKEFTELAIELESFASILTHRDFHAANLMVDDQGQLKIIDHQDARIGPASYDLVSLLLDRIIEIPSDEWLATKRRYFLNEREKAGLDKIEYEEFSYEFDLMTVQRCLKAIGTFSNQAGNFGRTHYTKFINPMFRVVLDACQRLDRFPVHQSVIRKEIGS